MNRYVVYNAADGWRWRLVAGNGETIADSGEAYVSKSNADRAVRSLTEPQPPDDAA